MAYTNYPSPYPAIPAGGYYGMPYQNPMYPYQQQNYGQGTQGNPMYQAPAVPTPLMPTNQNNQARQNNMILDWVQGPEAASAYYVEPGRGAILMDINRHTFYLTSRGEDNIPRPLQTFDYYQRQPQASNESYTDHTDYVSKNEYNDLERRIKEIEDTVKNGGVSHAIAEGANNVRAYD